jgi:hypothetical protein
MNNPSCNAEIIGPKLAPYNPTNIDAIKIALDLLDVKSTDILYDLGCGDARLLIEVSKLFSLQFTTLLITINLIWLM